MSKYKTGDDDIFFIFEYICIKNFRVKQAMHLVQINDLALLRRILGYGDIENWNRAVKGYMNEYYPDANLRFIAKECCWKVTHSEIEYFVDVDLMLNISNVSLAWSGRELSDKLDRACQTLEQIKAEKVAAKRVSFYE